MGGWANKNQDGQPNTINVKLPSRRREGKQARKRKAGFSRRGNGGNRPPVRCEVRNWWQIKSVIAIADEVFGDAEGFHATPSEVALTYYGYPDDAARVKKNKLIPKRAPQGPIYDAEDYRRRFPDGRFGSDPSLATEEIGERLLEAAVDELSADYQAFLAAT